MDSWRQDRREVLLLSRRESDERLSSKNLVEAHTVSCPEVSSSDEEMKSLAPVSPSSSELSLISFASGVITEEEETLEVEDNSIEEEEFDEGLNEQLKECALKHQCTRACVNDMLKIFNNLEISVPKDSRTLLSTRRNVSTIPMGVGKYIYIGVENCIKKLYSCCADMFNFPVLKLIVNTDGLPLFKSSSLSLWPILIQFGNFQPIGVAFYCGRTKPPFDIFLSDFVSEMVQLIENGILLGLNTFPVEIFSIPSDAPARALLKGIVQHTGYYSCERCTIKGVSVKRRIVFDQNIEEISPRDNKAFQNNLYGEEDDDGKRHQTKECPILRLPIDLINDIPLDAMHLVFLGVMHRMLYYLRGSVKHINTGKLSTAYLSAISKKLDNLNGSFPAEFARQPRGLSELDRWKATELKSFLLYSGPVVLRGFLSPSSWKHFLSLSLAIRMPSEEDDNIRNQNLESAKEHYGETFCVYNVHGLLHLADDVQRFQASLVKFSCFQF